MKIRAFELSFASVALVLALAAPLPAQEKLAPEEIVARHLASIGTPEARAAVKTRIADGEGTMNQVTLGSPAVTGPAIFLLDGKKMAMQILFSSPQYPEELFAFDGEKPQIRRVRIEGRSQLGEFFQIYSQIMREGLIGGALNTSWPLLNLDDKKPTLKYGGFEKVGDRYLHELRYAIRHGSSDFDIRLYFDPETFRHVRTTYKLTIRRGMRTSATKDLSANSVAETDNVTRYTLEEDFSDFVTVDGLALPKRWRIRFTHELIRATGFGTGNVVWEWDIRYKAIVHNETIDPKSFVIS